jgi:hypothetical protein
MMKKHTLSYNAVVNGKGNGKKGKAIPVTCHEDRVVRH